MAALEPTGWIGGVDEIATQAGSSIARAEAVLEVLQGFEPAGILLQAGRLLAYSADNQSYLPLNLTCWIIWNS